MSPAGVVVAFRAETGALILANSGLSNQSHSMVRSNAMYGSWNGMVGLLCCGSVVNLVIIIDVCCS